MTPDEQLKVEAMAAAIGEARRGGWLKPGETLPVNVEAQSGTSVIVGLAFHRHLARLRGEPRPSYYWRAFLAESREAEGANA